MQQHPCYQRPNGIGQRQAETIPVIQDIIHGASADGPVDESECNVDNGEERRNPKVQDAEGDARDEEVTECVGRIDGVRGDVREAKAVVYN